jgi:hypothetical protein
MIVWVFGVYDHGMTGGIDVRTDLGCGSLVDEALSIYIQTLWEHAIFPVVRSTLAYNSSILTLYFPPKVNSCHRL